MSCVRAIAWTAVLVFGLVGCGGDAAQQPVGDASSRRSLSRPAALLTRSPYMGVACGRANSIACDRVGLAVWLKRPAILVTATIDRRVLLLHAGGFGGRGPSYWEGYLQPAGLLAGPLAVTPDRGRFYWRGGHPQDARVVLAVRGRDDVTKRTSLRLGLHAGWG
jgi:hypothetical protein